MGRGGRRDQQGGDQQSANDLDHEDDNNRRHDGKGQPDGSHGDALYSGGDGVHGSSEKTLVHRTQHEEGNQSNGANPIQTRIVHKQHVSVQEPLNVCRDALAPHAKCDQPKRQCTGHHDGDGGVALEEAPVLKFKDENRSNHRKERGHWERGNAR